MKQSDGQDSAWAGRHLYRKEVIGDRMWLGTLHGVTLYSHSVPLKAWCSGESLERFVMESGAWQKARLMQAPEFHLSRDEWHVLASHLIGKGPMVPIGTCPTCNGTKRTIWWEAGMMQDCQDCSVPELDTTMDDTVF